MLLLVIKEHPKSEGVQQYAAAALAELAVSKEVCDVILEHDGLALLFAAFKRFVAEEAVEASVTQILDRLMELSEEARAPFCKLSPLDILSKVLANFKASEAVVYNVCGVLSSLAGELAFKIGRYAAALLKCIDECMELHQKSAHTESHVIKAVAGAGDGQGVPRCLREGGDVPAGARRAERVPGGRERGERELQGAVAVQRGGGVRGASAGGRDPEAVERDPAPLPGRGGAGDGPDHVHHGVRGEGRVAGGDGRAGPGEQDGDRDEPPQRGPRGGAERRAPAARDAPRGGAQRVRGQQRGDAADRVRGQVPAGPGGADGHSDAAGRHVRVRPGAAGAGRGDGVRGEGDAQLQQRQGAAARVLRADRARVGEPGELERAAEGRVRGDGDRGVGQLHGGRGDPAPRAGVLLAHRAGRELPRVDPHARRRAVGAGGDGEQRGGEARAAVRRHHAEPAGDRGERARTCCRAARWTFCSTTTRRTSRTTR